MLAKARVDEEFPGASLGPQFCNSGESAIADSPAEARSLTDEVKMDAERLWRKLVELYDGQAHVALGYSSWGAYFEAEFGGSDATAYRLLQSGRVMNQLPMGSQRPATERVARELSPLLDEPEVLRETWAEVVDKTNGKPTATQVREAVREVRETKPRVETPAVVNAIRSLYEATVATPQEELVAWAGDSRRLAREWACAKAYVESVYETRGETIPQIVRGEVI